jgi:5'-3' exonuclease
VAAKFGVEPQSIPDYLAVVGDAADGYPGVAGWGEKAAALMLSRHLHLENIPKDWRVWPPSVRGTRRLAPSLFESWEDALLFRTLATLRLDAPVFEDVDDLRWTGANARFDSYCRAMGSPDLYRRAAEASSRAVTHAAPGA